jgi:hypothetical protein
MESDMLDELNIPERFHPRVEANFMVKVLSGGRLILAKAHNLSMAGLYLQDFHAPDGELLTVALPLPDDKEVITTCRVRRDATEGCAVEFDQLDWEDLFALARFLHPRLP